jgi:hypothetical protein
MPLTLSVSESGGFELHDEDEWFDGQITEITETDDGQWGPGLKWIIELDGDTYTTDDGEEVQRETWAFCSQKLSKRSKLYGWVKGLGWDPEDEEVHLPDYIGKRCQVMFERFDGFDRDGNSQEKEKVVKIRAGKGKAKAKKPLKAVKDEEYDDAPF